MPCYGPISLPARAHWGYVVKAAYGAIRLDKCAAASHVIFYTGPIKTHRGCTGFQYIVRKARGGGGILAEASYNNQALLMPDSWRASEKIAKQFHNQWLELLMCELDSEHHYLAGWTSCLSYIQPWKILMIFWQCRGEARCLPGVKHDVLIGDHTVTLENRYMRTSSHTHPHTRTRTRTHTQIDI